MKNYRGIKSPGRMIIDGLLDRYPTFEKDEILLVTVRDRLPPDSVPSGRVSDGLPGQDYDNHPE